MLKNVMLFQQPLRGAGWSRAKPVKRRDSGCSKAAKARFPYDQAARKEFKHWCKDQWKIYKVAQIRLSLKAADIQPSDLMSAKCQ